MILKIWMEKVCEYNYSSGLFHCNSRSVEYSESRATLVMNLIIQYLLVLKIRLVSKVNERNLPTIFVSTFFVDYCFMGYSFD